MLRPFAHSVASFCVSFFSCCADFETGQTFSYVQTDAPTPNNLDSFWPTMLRPFAPSLSYGQCVTVRHSFKLPNYLMTWVLGV